MNTGRKIARIFMYIGIALAMLIMTQVVTFIVSLFVPGLGDLPETNPWLFILLVGICFTFAIFLVGWLALRIQWILSAPMYLLRLVATLVGVFLPLVLAVTVLRPLVAGHPMFTVSEFAGILGFFLPGWFGKK